MNRHTGLMSYGFLFSIATLVSYILYIEKKRVVGISQNVENVENG